jgi:hypothetical protein
MSSLNRASGSILVSVSNQEQHIPLAAASLAKWIDDPPLIVVARLDAISLLINP